MNKKKIVFELKNVSVAFDKQAIRRISLREVIRSKLKSERGSHISQSIKGEPNHEKVAA